MKFTVERSILSEAVVTASGAVASKAASQILEGLLIETDGKGSLKITGFDLEIAIICTIPSINDEFGSVVINAGTFGEIIRKLAGTQVTISVDENNKVDIDSGMTHFSIMASSYLDYPELPSVNYENSVEIEENKLESMIKQTVYAVSTNEAKPVHTGCLFEVNGSNIRVVGVDGYRLAIRNEEISSPAEEALKFNIPGKTLLKVTRMLKETDTKVKINVSRKHAQFEIENTILITRLLEGEFLNYNNAMPKEKSIEIVSDVRAFADSVERASLLINERQRSPIRLKFTDDQVKLFCSSPLGKIEDMFDVKSSGGNLEIGFNNKFLIDALRNSREEQVKIELNNSLSPMVIKPVEGDSFIFLILPVRLKTEE